MSHAGRDLYPFQQDGVHRLVSARQVLLADDMGLGKTIQAAVALKRLFDGSAIRRALIVCPASLLLNWKKELNEWASDVPVVLYRGGARHGMLCGGIPVLVGSYETIAGDLAHETMNGSTYTEIGIDLLIVDEAQRIKNPKSLTSRVVSKILAPRRWALTGTPIENRLGDLAAILRFLEPNEFEEETDFGDERKVLAGRDVYLLRRTKDSVLSELPPKRTSYVPVDMSAIQKAHYDLALLRLRQAIIESDDPSRLRAILLGGLSELRLRAVISEDGSSGKLELLEEELESAADQKVVVFSTFAEKVLPLVHEALRRYGTVLYTGSMTLENRSRAHDRFLQDPDTHVMCASLKAAGVGLTWTVATLVYHLDLWWNPQVLRQAEDRVHRIGQTRGTIVKRLVSSGTIEEGVVSLLGGKEKLFDFVVEGAALPGEPSSSTEKLLNLIGMKLNSSGKPLT